MNRTANRLPFFLLSGFALFLFGCPSDDDDGAPGWDSSQSDGGTDLGAELDEPATTDLPNDLEPSPDLTQDDVPDVVPDADDDPVEDLVPDESADPAADGAQDADYHSCPYPEGSYDFSAAGDRVGPMIWPGAFAGELESLPADLWAMHCDPEVHSVFIQVSSTTCPNCPTRLAEIRGLQDHWEEHGAKWIFIVTGAASNSAANSYIDNESIDFGWRTDDSDNSLGADTIADSSAFAAVPWTGVIRTSDMTLVYDESDTAYLDIEAIAEALDPD